MTEDCLVLIANSTDKTLGTGILRAESGGLDKWRTTPFEGVEGANGPSPICLSPDRSLLYVAFRGTPPQVLTFRIDPGGPGLTQIGSAPLADSMAYVAVDRTGRYLFAASYGGGIVTMNRIGADGIAGPEVARLDAGPMAHCIVVSADNRQIYVPSVGAERIGRFDFDATAGTLRPAPHAATFPAGTGPRHLVLHGSNRFAFCVNQTEGSVSAFSLRPDGSFDVVDHASIAGPPALGEPLASDIHLTPDGRFLYASERTSDCIVGFSVDAEHGSLREIGRFAVPKTPRGFAIDPTGRHLVSLAEAEATATVWRIASDSGVLSLRGTYDIGNGPNWVELVPVN
ncbi:MAG: lactonase family protein [Cypionkella sp.]